MRRDAALRRALTDSSVEGEARSGLARAVFGTALGDQALDLVADAASRRWIVGKDLPDALERLAVAATVRSAGAKGKQVGDELFAVRQMIDANPTLRGALADQLAHRRGPQRRCSRASSTARPSRPPPCSWDRP